jgi:hypothetical protein
VEEGIILKKVDVESNNKIYSLIIRNINLNNVKKKYKVFIYLYIIDNNREIIDLFFNLFAFVALINLIIINNFPLVKKILIIKCQKK